MICNLKASKSFKEIIAYHKNLTKLDFKGLNLIMAPSNIYLPLFQESTYFLATQNLDLYADFSLTGDTSLAQLKGLNVKYILLGHFERRFFYQEDENLILKKIIKALNQGFKVIYCLGETKEELERHITPTRLIKSLANILNYLTKDQINNLIIAYEPSYLIGTKTNYDLKELTSNIKLIKDTLINTYKINIPLVFGGNINPQNIQDFLPIKELDGFIIGSSALDISTLTQIIDLMATN